jgi:uncharacterized membrane protein
MLAGPFPCVSERPGNLGRSFGLVLDDRALDDSEAAIFFVVRDAVNDPSTAISCVDQLSRILIRWLGRVPPPNYLYGPPHVLRVVLPQIRLDGLLDTAFEQIRHYSQSDVAVSLRLLRAFDDVAQTVSDLESRATLLQRASRVVTGCAPHLPEEDLAKLRQRLMAVEANVVDR